MEGLIGPSGWYFYLFALFCRRHVQENCCRRAKCNDMMTSLLSALRLISM